MRIGLTGGMGSGVSEAGRRLENLGAPVISADEIGHEVLRLPEVKRELVQAFGERIIDGKGEIQRAALGGIIFAEEPERKKLNRIVHPILLDILSEEVRRTEGSSGVAVVDAALIYEWRLEGFFHKMVVVHAPLELRIQRLKQREGWSREEVLQRFESQMALEKKVEKADYVIENDGSLESLYRQVDFVWGELVRQMSC